MEQNFVQSNPVHTRPKIEEGTPYKKMEYENSNFVIDNINNFTKQIGFPLNTSLNLNAQVPELDCNFATAVKICQSKNCQYVIGYVQEEGNNTPYPCDAEDTYEDKYSRWTGKKIEAIFLYTLGSIAEEFKYIGALEPHKFPLNTDHEYLKAIIKCNSVDDELQREAIKPLFNFAKAGNENAFSHLLTLSTHYHKAQYKTGLCYENGYGVEKSIPSAIYHYRELARDGVEKGEQKLYALAKNGESEAQFYLRKYEYYPYLLLNDLNNLTKKINFNYIDYSPSTHRFENIDCQSSTALKNSRGYVHANVMVEFQKKKLIASQAPYKDAFWAQMLEDEAMIFDLTEKGEVNCYPGPESLMSDGGINVQLIQCKFLKPNCSRYTYRVTEGEKSKEFDRVHINKWPDISTPSPELLDDIVEMIGQAIQEIEKDIWIHCRAGVGRTGTVIAALLLKMGIDKGEITESNMERALVEIVYNLRQKRCSNMVQTEEQFTFLYKYAQQLLEKASHSLL